MPFGTLAYCACLCSCSCSCSCHACCTIAHALEAHRARLNPTLAPLPPAVNGASFLADLKPAALKVWEKAAHEMRPGFAVLPGQ